MQIFYLNFVSDPKKPLTVVVVTYLIYFFLVNTQLHPLKSISEQQEAGLSDLIQISTLMEKCVCPCWVPGKVLKENNGMKLLLYFK